MNQLYTGGVTMLDYLRVLLTAHCKTPRGATAVEYALLVAGVGAAFLLMPKTIGILLPAPDFEP